MTPTYLQTEMRCKYGDTFRALLERVHDLRITYPNKDIFTHSNDVKSCVKQLKLQPNVMAVFSIQVVDFLFLQNALPFGTNFLPQNWEPVRPLTKILAETLFNDERLQAKQRKYLDRL